MALAPGTRLGPYELGSQIGAGGMGEVCGAVDTRPQRSVAVKILPHAGASVSLSATGTLVHNAGSASTADLVRSDRHDAGHCR